MPFLQNKDPFYDNDHLHFVTSSFIYTADQEKLTLTDIGILMTAAVCHDLDHPGYNNT